MNVPIANQKVPSLTLAFANINFFFAFKAKCSFDELRNWLNWILGNKKGPLLFIFSLINRIKKIYYCYDYQSENRATSFVAILEASIANGLPFLSQDLIQKFNSWPKEIRPVLSEFQW